MLEHGPMSRVCAKKRDELNAYFKTGPAAGHMLDIRKHLHVVTNTFADMLQHRHTADYNGAVSWTRTDVLQKIQSVEAAFKSWHAIRDEPEAQEFLLKLLLKER